MFEIDENQTIHITRGDIANIKVSCVNDDGSDYDFHKGDIVRFRVFNKRKYDDVLICKDVLVEDTTSSVTIFLESDDTKLGDVTNKIIDYGYEVELNPDTCPQTIIGHDKLGMKVFTVYPEGGDPAWL